MRLLPLLNVGEKNSKEEMPLLQKKGKKKKKKKKKKKEKEQNEERE